jgi:hypothetical protein
MDNGAGLLGWAVSPQEIDQSVAPNRAVRFQGQDTKYQLMLSFADIEKFVPYHDLDRPENPEFHRAPFATQRVDAA